MPILFSRFTSIKDKENMIFLLPSFTFFPILALTLKGGMRMPFWTKFWVLVPPIVLFAITLIFYIVSGKKKEG